MPENCETPIAADFAMTGGAAASRSRVELDWRQEGPQTWDITVETDGGRLRALARAGRRCASTAPRSTRAPEREYPLIYRRFAELLGARESEVDASPLRIIADAFLVGERETDGAVP